MITSQQINELKRLIKSTTKAKDITLEFLSNSTISGIKNYIVRCDWINKSRSDIRFTDSSSTKNIEEAFEQLIGKIKSYPCLNA